MTAGVVPSNPLAIVETPLIHASNLMQPEFRGVVRFLGGDVKQMYFA